MRILLDYRPALKARSGVGEWVHELSLAILALASSQPGAYGSIELTLFTSSWKDRPTAAALEELSGARFIDRRVPVSILNLGWNRLGWPMVESLAGQAFDVVLAPHPLLIPARSGLRVITIHDLDFLEHPDRTRAEIRRDYPALVRRHARRADLVVVVSEDTARQVESRLGVSHDRLVICASGVPAWIRSLPSTAAPPSDGHVLFVGTLDARKNIGGLLEAYRLLVERRPETPRLVLVGRSTPDSARLLGSISSGPLAGRVDIRGYVDDAGRREAFAGARLLVIPSFHEGFGLPALEAMALGVPVVSSNRGALPEVVGDAGLLVNPDDPPAIAAAIGRVLDDVHLAEALAARGRLRARQFTWESSAIRMVRRFQHEVSPAMAPAGAGSL